MFWTEPVLSEPQRLDGLHSNETWFRRLTCVSLSGGFSISWAEVELSEVSLPFQLILQKFWFWISSSKNVKTRWRRWTSVMLERKNSDLLTSCLCLRSNVGVWFLPLRCREWETLPAWAAFHLLRKMEKAWKQFPEFDFFKQYSVERPSEGTSTILIRISPDGPPFTGSTPHVSVSTCTCAPYPAGGAASWRWPRSESPGRWWPLLWRRQRPAGESLWAPPSSWSSGCEPSESASCTPPAPPSGVLKNVRRSFRVWRASWTSMDHMITKQVYLNPIQTQQHFTYLKHGRGCMVIWVCTADTEVSSTLKMFIFVFFSKSYFQTPWTTSQSVDGNSWIHKSSIYVILKYFMRPSCLPRVTEVRRSTNKPVKDQIHACFIEFLHFNIQDSGKKSLQHHGQHPLLSYWSRFSRSSIPVLSLLLGATWHSPPVWCEGGGPPGQGEPSGSHSCGDPREGPVCTFRVFWLWPTFSMVPDPTHHWDAGLTFHCKMS